MQATNDNSLLPARGPFSLDDEPAYRRWREAKLADHPASLAELQVTIRDPLQLSAAERHALGECCRRANMAIYRLRRPQGDPADKEGIRALGAQLGLLRLHHNLCADEDGISSLRVVNAGQRHTYIPYSSRPISWHTDGYYHPPGQRIRGMLLHCVQPAARGGDNALLDPEIAYIHLRDSNPDYIYALMHPRAMTIPANDVEDGEPRPAQSGSVFSVDEAGHLHMRYTARTRSIEWRDDADTRAATACLNAFLASDSPWIFRHRLAAGEGLICNNVLHNRSAFEDGETPRLLYRARYLDRVRI